MIHEPQYSQQHYFQLPNMEATLVSIKTWIDKEDVTHTHTHTHTHTVILLSHKKEWNSAICNNMNGFGRYYAKWNKSDRERQILNNITYMWNLKIYKTN